MKFLVTLNGAPSNEGFLIAGGPSGALRLQTTDGSTVTANLLATGPQAASIQFSATTVAVGPGGATVDTTATAASTARGGAQSQVTTGGAVDQVFAATAIDSPVIQFEGRYQCRLATDPDGFDNLWGQDSSFGMYSLSPVEPPLDRIIRFQGALALRPFCAPIGVFVRRIRGSLSGGSIELFTAGDSVIGLPVSLGPNCKFDARDGAFAQPGFEPISDFRLSIANVFQGETDPALPRVDPSAPPPSRAPYADGLFRMDMTSPRKPADLGYPDATWTARSTRITTEKIAALNAQAPATPAETALRDRRKQEHTGNLGGIQFALRLLERYSGVIDKALVFTPGSSAVLRRFQTRLELPLFTEFFDFDTDCQSGTIWGTLG